MDGDYDDYSEFSESEVGEMLSELEDFLVQMEKLLKPFL